MRYEPCPNPILASKGCRNGNAGSDHWRQGRRLSGEPSHRHAAKDHDAEQKPVDDERPARKVFQHFHQAPDREEGRNGGYGDTKRAAPTRRARADGSCGVPTIPSTRPARSPAGPSRKDSRAASSRLKPSISAAVKVEPERETPGMSAPVWARPTMSASAMRRLVNGAPNAAPKFRRSTSSAPITRQVQPMTLTARSGELQVLRSLASVRPGNSDRDGGKDDPQRKLERAVAELSADGGGDRIDGQDPARPSRNS